MHGLLLTKKYTPLNRKSMYVCMQKKKKNSIFDIMRVHKYFDIISIFFKQYYIIITPNRELGCGLHNQNQIKIRLNRNQNKKTGNLRKRQSCPLAPLPRTKPSSPIISSSQNQPEPSIRSRKEFPASRHAKMGEANHQSPPPSRLEPLRSPQHNHREPPLTRRATHRTARWLPPQIYSRKTSEMTYACLSPDLVVILYETRSGFRIDLYPFLKEPLAADPPRRSSLPHLSTAG